MTDAIPMRIPCPECGELHIDEGEFSTKSHATHACQFCGMVWRPAVVNTVGVRVVQERVAWGVAARGIDRGYRSPDTVVRGVPPGPPKSQFPIPQTERVDMPEFNGFWHWLGWYVIIVTVTVGAAEIIREARNKGSL